MGKEMAKITYVEHCGREHVVDVENDLTVMEGARNIAFRESTPIAVAPVRARPVMFMSIHFGSADCR